MTESTNSTDCKPLTEWSREEGHAEGVRLCDSYLGGRRLPHAPQLTAIASSLGVTCDWLLGFPGQPSPTGTAPDPWGHAIPSESPSQWTEGGQAPDL